MEIIKILKRKDAASVIVAVVLSFILIRAVEGWSQRPADWLSGQRSTGGGWNAGFWQPLVMLVVELVVFEIVIRVYTWLTATSGKK